MNKERLQYLLYQFSRRQCSREEFNELMTAVADPQYRAWLEELADAGADQLPSLAVTPDFDWEHIYRQVMQTENENSGGGRMRRLIRRVAVAASVLLAVGLGSYFIFFNKNKNSESPIAKTTDVSAPDKSRASITLADGRTIYLDSLEAGTIATQNQVTVTKDANGNIVYASTPSTASAPTAVAFNTLSNPRGSKVIDLNLSDGSHVWLNAGSSITYPIAFIGNERKITMTGEGYFEVTHNAKMPFTVSANGVDIHDLGTSFNVNAYSDEADIKITLLEGKVQVEKIINAASQTLNLVPGQQAIVAKDLKLAKDVDLEQAIAWKNNRFIFSGENIQSVMRQLARWYDVDVNYNGTIPADEFVGVISRSRYENISAVLDMLEKTKTVSFKIEGRKITVLPWKQ